MLQSTLVGLDHVGSSPTRGFLFPETIMSNDPNESNEPHNVGRHDTPQDGTIGFTEANLAQIRKVLSGYMLKAEEG